MALGCGRSVTTAEDIWGRCPIQMLPEHMSHTTLLDEVWLEHVRKVRMIQTLEKYEMEEARERKERWRMKKEIWEREEKGVQGGRDVLRVEGKYY